MPVPSNYTLAEVLEAPPADRLDAVDQILDSLSHDAKVNPKYATEAQRRWDAFERGEMDSVPADQVFKMMEEGSLCSIGTCSPTSRQANSRRKHRCFDERRSI